MSPVTHFLAGWAAANTVTLGRRDRLIVTLSGIAPDFDALGIVGNLATRGSENPVYWWEEYHHVLGHNIGFALALTIVTLLAAKRRFTAALLVFASVNIHLLADLVGARGPDGYQWLIPYLEPFSSATNLTGEGERVFNTTATFTRPGAQQMSTACIGR